MATSEMTDIDAAGQDSNQSLDRAVQLEAGSKFSKYKIAIVLGVIAICLYVCSIVSIIYSRGVIG